MFIVPDEEYSEAPEERHGQEILQMDRHNDS